VRPCETVSPSLSPNGPYRPQSFASPTELQQDLSQSVTRAVDHHPRRMRRIGMGGSPELGNLILSKPGFLFQPMVVPRQSLQFAGSGR